MALQSSLWFAPVDPMVVPTPAPGYFALFISNGAGPSDAGRVYKKDSTGMISSAAGDDHAIVYTDEMARDAVGAILQNSGSIQLTYDDDLNFISATVIDASITTAHLSDGSVTTVKVLDGAITGSKLADNAVTVDKLADFSVGNQELQPASVTASKLADNVVSNAKLADASVSNTKLEAGAVTASKLADNAVTNAKLADASVTNSKIAPLAITSGNLADTTVTAAKLATDAVTQIKIADAAVGTAELIDGNVTTAKLATDAVTQVKIADAAVGTAELIDGNVTTAKLATDAVTQIKIADAAVGTAELVDGGVTTAKLATDAVTQIKIADAAVGTAELADGAVTAVKLGTDAVTNAKLADNAVNTAELADGAVTNTKLASMAAGTIKMRPTGTAGAPTDATLAAVKTALAITASDVSGLGTAATMAATAFDAAGLAAAAQAASQPLDSDLSAIAALSTTAYGRALLTLPDATADTAQLNVATAAIKGLMSAADKSKLDSISVITNKLRYTVTDNGILTSNTGAQNLTAWNTLMSTIPDNSEVYFPPGPSTFTFSGTMVIPAGKHLKIAGASNQKSMIATTSATADIFQVNDWYNEFDGLKFTSTVTRTAGAAINSGNNVAISVYDCDFNGMWDGIVYTGGNSAGNLAVIENCGFTGTLNRGIVLDGRDANTIIDKVVMDGTLGQQQVGLELLQCGSVLVSNSDFIRAQNNLRFNPVSPNGVFSAYFVNTFFDTSAASSVKFQGTGNIQRVKFTNCWFSGSVTGCEFASTATTLPTAIDFIGCDIFGNSSRGIYANGVQDFSATNCRIAGNTTAGIEANASTGAVTKFNLTNNAICPTAGFGANGTGILINAGTFGGYAIKNNDLRNNTTNNLTDNGTVATSDLKIINDNFGHIITGSLGNLASAVTQSGMTAGALLTVRVPAKAATVGQVFRLRLLGNATASGTVTFRVYVGATGGLTDAVAYTSITSGTLSANNRAGLDGMLTVRTAGASGAVQCEALGFGNTGLLPAATATPATVTINTLNPWFITIGVTGSLGSGFAAQQAVVEAL